MPPTYYMSPYTPETWEAAVEHLGNRQAAFAATQKTVAKKSIQPGDIFLCYIIGGKEIVAALRATSRPAFVRPGDGILRLMMFPIRVDTDPLVRVPLGSGVALNAIKEHSAQPRTWISLVQGALKRVPPDDAKWIVSQLQKRARSADASRAAR